MQHSERIIVSDIVLENSHIVARHNHGELLFMYEMVRDKGKEFLAVDGFAIRKQIPKDRQGLLDLENIKTIDCRNAPKRTCVLRFECVKLIASRNSTIYYVICDDCVSYGSSFVGCTISKMEFLSDGTKIDGSVVPTICINLMKYEASRSVIDNKQRCGKMVKNYCSNYMNLLSVPKNFTVKVLRELCRKFKIKVSGKKSELIERINRHLLECLYDSEKSETSVRICKVACSETSCLV